MSMLSVIPRSSNSIDPYSDPAYIAALISAFREKYMLIAYALIAVTPSSPQVRNFFCFCSLIAPWCSDSMPILAFLSVWFMARNGNCGLISVVTWHYILQLCYNAPLRTFLCVLEFMPSIISGVFSALRVYALLQSGAVACSVSALVILLFLVTTANNAYNISTTSYYFVDDPVLGATCYAASSNSVHRLTTCPVILCSFALTDILSALAANALVSAVTLLKTYRQVQHALSLGIRADFSTTLLQYGTMSVYYVCRFHALGWSSTIDVDIWRTACSASFVLNGVQLVIEQRHRNVSLLSSAHLMPYLPHTQPSGTTVPMESIILIMQPIIISRFLIDLRGASVSSSDSAGATIGTAAGSVSMPVFEQRVVSPMGSTVRWGENENEDQEDLFQDGEERAADAELDGGGSLQS
ncbi:hypothetical protein NM688_g7445 [Phlebia brevispora]|uniref:Uncharacterized protein n=1 Tax=Phlebia brevispora TaxID=194682 RepID=A0ACC1S550_9APHY|nr:hypothetical protein NM688_g7445 [Phlebia brevispora]